MAEVEQIGINDLIPYAGNAKKHPEEQVLKIASSIKEFGFNSPILIDSDNGVIAGHGRLLGAKKLKLSTVPCVRVNLSGAQKKAYILADNRLGEIGGAEWDMDLVSLELEQLSDLDFDIDLTGFSIDDIIPEETEGLTDEDEVPEVPQDPITKSGDVWILGNHRLMCGDSTSIDDVEKLMDGAKADFCFTSPPYADQREYNGGKELSTEHLATFIRASVPTCDYFVINLGVSRKNGEINRYWDDYLQEAENCGLKLLSWNVWDKGECGSIGNQSAMFGIVHEWLFVLGRERKEINRTQENKSAGQMANHTGNRQADGTIVQSKDTVIGSHRNMDTITRQVPQKARNLEFDHPAMFPVDLPVRYIEAMTNNKDNVFEPFGGSGTTLIACEKTNRINYSMELDPKYCDVIIKRWQDYTGNDAIHENGAIFNNIQNVEYVEPDTQKEVA